MSIFIMCGSICLIWMMFLFFSSPHPYIPLLEKTQKGHTVLILSLSTTDMNLSSSELSVFWKGRQPALLLLTVLLLRIERNSLLHNAASLHPGMRWRSFAKRWSKLFLILLHHLTWDENIAFISHNNIDVRVLAGVKNCADSVWFSV